MVATKTLAWFVGFILVCILIFKILPTLFLVFVGLSILFFGTVGWYKLQITRKNFK